MLVRIQLASLPFGDMIVDVVIDGTLDVSSILTYSTSLSFIGGISGFDRFYDVIIAIRSWNHGYVKMILNS